MGQNSSLEKRAEAGEPEAIYELAKSFFYGIGMPRDRVKARHYYKQLAKFHPKEVDFIGYGTLLAFIGKLSYSAYEYEEALFWYERAKSYIQAAYTETFAKKVIEDITLEQCIKEAKAALKGTVFS